MKSLQHFFCIVAVLALVLGGCKKDDSTTCTDGIMNGDETGVDCGGDCDPCGTNNCSITDFSGSGTAIGVAPNNCGDRPITVTNDGISTVTLDMPVPNAGTLTLIGQITSGCSFSVPLDTISDGGIEAYYSGSGSLNGNTLTFTYRADFNFGSGFDCDYTVNL